MSLLDNINPDAIDFVNRREIACAREALQAMSNVVSGKNSLNIPLAHETYEAVEQLEALVFALKWATLQPRPSQTTPEQVPAGS